MNECLRIVVLGRSLTSSAENPYLGAYRSLLREVYALGHDILYLQPDSPGRADDPDLPRHYFCHVERYQSLDELKSDFGKELAQANIVILTSGIADGVAVTEWALATAACPVALHDLDTPATLASLVEGQCDFLSPELIGRFDLVLTSSGGPSIDLLRRMYGVRCVKTLYAAFDQELFYPQHLEPRWDLGYRAPHRPGEAAALDRLLIKVAESWPDLELSLAGPGYPDDLPTPSNLSRLGPVGRAEQRRHDNVHRFMLSLSSSCPSIAGFSPSARMFEACACGVPVIAQHSTGLESFLEPGDEVLTARSTDDVATILRTLPDDERRRIGMNARERVLREHTVAQRALELERVLSAVLASRQSKAYLL
jgi:spore maturation protein CgeB